MACNIAQRIDSFLLHDAKTASKPPKPIPPENQALVELPPSPLQEASNIMNKRAMYCMYFIAFKNRRFKTRAFI